jgi:hypothetical protein
MCLLSYIDIFSFSDYKPDMNKTPVLLYPAVFLLLACLCICVSGYIYNSLYYVPLQCDLRMHARMGMKSYIAALNDND